MTMAPLPLDFRRHPTRRWRWVGWGLLAIAAVGALVLGRNLTDASLHRAAAESRQVIPALEHGDDALLRVPRRQRHHFPCDPRVVGFDQRHAAQ